MLFGSFQKDTVNCYMEKIREFLDPAFHELARQKCYLILEGYMAQDHVHMLIEIPATYAVPEIHNFPFSRRYIGC